MRPSPALFLLFAAACAPRLYADVEDTTWQVPEENGWPLEVPPEPLVGTGFAEGETVPDVRGPDQHGNDVSIWQFWGNYVLLDISTMWCGPCQNLAKGTEATHQEFKDENFVYLTVLHENEQSEPCTEEELNLWATFPSAHDDPDHPYDLITAPIISDPFGESGSADAVENGQYPIVILIGPDMKVIDRIDPASEVRIHSVLVEHLE